MVAPWIMMMQEITQLKSNSRLTCSLLELCLSEVTKKQVEVGCCGAHFRERSAVHIKMSRMFRMPCTAPQTHRDHLTIVNVM